MTLMTDPQNLNAYMADIGRSAKAAANELRLASSDTKAKALNAMAKYIHEDRAFIEAENLRDMQAARKKALSEAMLDRLALNEARIENIASGLKAIAALPDPVGAVEKDWVQPNGLKFSKVKTPIGVIGMIYESRPNVTADAGALSVKSGNACVLRGGSESINSNRAIHASLVKGLEEVGLPATAIQLINTTDRDAVGLLLGGLGNTVDLIIPRGGKNLIARVQKDARIPVLAHLEGLCHSYIHHAADRSKALDIVENAKMRRTGVCGSTETVLIDPEIAGSILPDLSNRLTSLGCELRGDVQACRIIPTIEPASESDFATEHLAPILNVAIVNNIDGALQHIAKYGSGHTDAIITEDAKAADKFLSEVDSAICIHNASTQFADGGEFGFGAEIGIATGRLHARGPVGAEHLTTYKYQLRGTGQIRPK